MTMSTLMCPHCGGRLLIDPTLRLQSMLTCPYCARKSLMQKKNGMIVLRGIIASSTTNPESAAGTASAEPKDETVDDTATAKGDHEPPVESVDSGQPTVKPDESPEVIQPFEPFSGPTVEPDIQQTATLEMAPAVMAETPQPIAPDAEQPVALEREPDVQPEVEQPVAVQETEPSILPERDHTAVPDDEPAASPDSEPPIELAASEESIPDAVIHVDARPESGSPPVDHAMPADAEAAVISEAKQTIVEPASRQEQLIDLATRAAVEGSIMAFNSYARQAIDCDPTDPRMYVLRSRLIEQAHGFGRATFLSPVWMSYTPRQKAFVIAQHFSSFNAAIHYSAETDKTAVAVETGRLIAWQIREAIIENARLRLGKRPFNGKFRRQDLGTAPRIIDSMRSVNETVVPQVADELLRSIRVELDKLDPKLYYQLLRSGF